MMIYFLSYIPDILLSLMYTYVCLQPELTLPLLKLLLLQRGLVLILKHVVNVQLLLDNDHMPTNKIINIAVINYVLIIFQNKFK